MFRLGTRGKTAVGFRSAMVSFAQAYMGNLYFWSFTFAENVQDLGEAQKRYKPLADLLRREGVEWMGVWEVQNRGAWHLHVLVNKRMDVAKLRPWLEDRGWGTQMKAVYLDGQKPPRNGFRQAPKTGMDASGVIRYLAKYLTKTTNILCAGKRSLVVCVRKWRTWNTRWQWAGGSSRLWRLGMEWFMTLHTQLPKFHQYGQVWALGWEAVRNDTKWFLTYYRDPELEPF